MISSDNGVSPVRHQAIIRTNVDLLAIGTLRINFSGILIEIQTCQLKKMHWKMSSAHWRLFRIVSSTYYEIVCRSGVFEASCILITADLCIGSLQITLLCIIPRRGVRLSKMLDYCSLGYYICHLKIIADNITNVQLHVWYFTDKRLTRRWLYDMNSPTPSRWG